MPLAPGTRFGSYEILSLLGAGGMGEVYRARDGRLARDVALKTISPRLAAEPDALARFQREAKVIAALSHPHILTIYDVGNEAGVWFLVTELLEGETLRERLSREDLGWTKAVEIAVAVAEGLASAHARGIVHRDLKPENVFLTSEGHVKILDFGLARQAPPNAEVADTRSLSNPTEPGAVVGTVAYMSPEQLRGRPLDPRSDIFSLGCVLHEMLSRHAPFLRPTAVETMAAILKDPPPAAADACALPAELERLVLHCLEKNRDERFQSVRDLAFALKALSSGASARPAHPGRARSPSVAVLPFVNLSADPENEFFADGITEDVIAHLSKVRALKVISRTSVMAFKKREHSLCEIGLKLGAATLLEGSVRRAGNRVRIVAQLIDGESDDHIWVDTYDRELTDIFEIQTDVALRIAAALQAELSPDERARIRRRPTHDMEAYQLYLQGRQCLFRYTAEAFRDSISLYEQAIARDPTFALAHAALAHVYAELGVEGFGPQSPALNYQKARETVAKALALDDSLGEAYGIAGLIRLVGDFDWSGAEGDFKLALELSPGSADVHDHYGWLCSALERHDDALREVRRARELDPLAHRSDVASYLLRAGRVQEALEEAARVIESEPGFSRGHAIWGWAQMMLRREAEGVAALERAAALSPGSTLFLGQLGQAYGMTGQSEKARDVLAHLKDLAQRGYVSPYHIAYVYTGLGDQDAAMDWLERAYVERAGALYGIKGSFLFTSLRRHPRFTALMSRMNLV